jgi:hypothetical protein
MHKMCPKLASNRVWWYMPIIPALRSLRQEAPEFEASLGL